MRWGQLGYAQLANDGLLNEHGGVTGDEEKSGEDDVVEGWDIGDLKEELMASAKASEGIRRLEFGEGEGDSEQSLLLSSEPISST